jgi:hypothetical protein
VVKLVPFTDVEDLYQRVKVFKRAVSSYEAPWRSEWAVIVISARVLFLFRY